MWGADGGARSRRRPFARRDDRPRGKVRASQMSSPILPKARIARVGFLEVRLPGWLANALALGTTAPTITSLTTLTNSARAAYEAQQLAIGQAQAATQNFYDAVALMTDAASDVIKQIKVK